MTTPACQSTRGALGERQQGVPDETLERARVLPVIALQDPQAAVPLAQALIGAGIEVMEITLRAPGALDAIEAVATLVPQMAIAAGTVKTPTDLRQAAEAGAQFALSPGSTLELLEADEPIALIPGVSTASEVMRALANGYQLLKLFPADLCGGPGLLNAWRGPLAEASFIPTGGINATNASAYLELSNVLCVGGSFLVPSDLGVNSDWAQVEAQVVETLQPLR